MRILFLCSSLEPGRDGVGDYVRLLAGECIRPGHVCGIIGLHDGYVTEPVESVIENERGKIPFLRLPRTEPWPERLAAAKAWRSRFQPDVISFQFVPYGFDEKGIVLELNPFFHELTAGCPLHLMFHELWIGSATFTPVRHRVVGAIQRRSLKKMLSQLQPRRVTTSNPIYVSMLKRLGTRATILPLFGNIPIAPVANPAQLPTELIEAGVVSRKDWWLAIFFGTLHPEWKPEPLMGLLRRAARRARKRVALLLAGRPGTTGEVTWDHLRHEYHADFVFVKFGERPVAELSGLLQMADFGLAASPWQLIGKSGTVAAMLDHGLPVIVARDDFKPLLPVDESPMDDPLVHRCDEMLEAKLVAGLPRQPPRNRLGEITARFCAQLATPPD